MKNVEFYDWKLNSGKPFSCLVPEYNGSIKPRRPDMHSALHLGLVLNGECTGRFAGERVRSTAGEFYLTAPWEPHCTITTAPYCRLLLLNIDLVSLQSAFFTAGDHLETLLLMPPEQRMRHINVKLRETAIREMLMEMINMAESSRKELLLWNLIQNVFIRILPEAELAAEPRGDYQRLLPALKGLSGRMLSTGEAAKKCSLSTGYFSILFKKQFGMSFGRYERNFRLNGAEDALRRGSSLKEAAYNWGFCDKSHLARLLKRRTGQ